MISAGINRRGTGNSYYRSIFQHSNTSESDSKARRCSSICHTIFSFHYAHESAWLRHNEALRGAYPIYFLLLAVSVPFLFQLMANLKEGDRQPMWEFVYKF
jgi:hypothetical protein